MLNFAKLIFIYFLDRKYVFISINNFQYKKALWARMEYSGKILEIPHKVDRQAINLLLHYLECFLIYFLFAPSS